MVISPGEWDIALDSLTRLFAHSKGLGIRKAYIVNNTGETLDSHRFPMDKDIREIVVQKAPRPYFEIAKTIFGALTRILREDVEFDVLVKVDPDTLILSEDYFRNYADIFERTKADFVAPFTKYSLRNDLQRYLRNFIDMMPIGFTRKSGGSRYGNRIGFRFGRTWMQSILFRCFLKLKLGRAQPSGGGYAVSSRSLRAIAEKGYLSTTGKDGLEWNDDLYMPLAVSATDGLIVDIRDTKHATGWRFVHGAKYFSTKALHSGNIVAVHPLKDNPKDWQDRKSIPLND